MVEAVETAWTKFTTALLDARNLDSLINLHETFQNDVLDGAFLTSRNEAVYRQLLRMFDLIFRFKYMQEILIQNASECNNRLRSEDINR
jgi:hypothetical protein